MKRAAAFLLACLLGLGLLAPALAQSGFYALGDTVEDFTLTTSVGETVSLYGLLKEHKAVLLNFWFADCGPCRYEFPFLVEAYEQFGGDVAVLGITPRDQDARINDYIASVGINFPMAYDSAGVSARFVDYGFPTSVMIDREGVLCFTECGAQRSADAFVRLFQPFVAEDYASPLLLDAIPAAEMPDAPDAAALNSALNAAGSELDFEIPDGVWPWLVSQDGTYAYSGNPGAHASLAQVGTQVITQPGDVLRFRFATSTEDGSDVLAVLMDDQIVKIFSGENPWQAYALPFDGAGEHAVDFVYLKSAQDSAGADTVMVADVALLSGEEAQAALQQNPRYPLTLEGTEAEVSFPAGQAREILFDDPTGAVDGYYGADGYYILSGGAAEALIKLGADCDPDAAVVSDALGAACSVSHCAQAREGFLFPLPAVSGEMGWNAVLLYPSILDAYGAPLIYLYFASPEDADAFCLSQVFSPATGEPVSGVTWQYARPEEETLPAEAPVSGSADYTLVFADQDGQPVPGVIANICTDTMCTPMVADAEGRIAFSLPAYTYDIHVIKIPDGYAFDLSQDFQTPENGGVMTFTLNRD